jgi:hypothetical protein
LIYGDEMMKFGINDDNYGRNKIAIAPIHPIHET